MGEFYPSAALRLRGSDSRIEIHRVNHADYRGVDRRVRAADCGHRRESFRGEQDALADARADGVERQYGFAAIAAIEIERLNDEDLAAFMRRDFLRSNHVTDNARD
jgi:hypothetical protein